MRSLRLAAAIGIAGVTVFAQAETWRFVVAGDGRSDPGARPPRAEDKDGVNTVITAEMARAVLREKARFLLWTGDLALGSKSDAAVFERQLRRWRGIMQPVYDRHVPVMAVRGNHESGSAHSEAVWNRVFSGSYAMPQNGPIAEKNLTFFGRFGPVLAVGLDQYKSGGISVDQRWLDGVLKQYRRPFVFAMAHEPAFMDGAHKDNMDNEPAKRDAFWNSLIHAGSRCFFVGHDHLYDHMAVTRAGTKPGPVMHQFVAGTAGAPFYKKGEYVGNNTGWTLRRLKHIDRTYGYIVVEIDGNRATVTFKGRVGPDRYVPMDSFSYVANSPR